MMTPYVITLLSVAAAASATAAVGANTKPNGDVQARNAGAEPYLGSYDVEDSCQYKLCGSEYMSEFGGGRTPAVGSCSGDCDSLAHMLINSKFKREFMWGRCTSMCTEKFSTAEFKTYNNRLTCVDECFQAFERVSPHRHVAQACVHAACSERQRAHSGMSAMECFSECTHHVATNVPAEDWPAWSNLLSSSDCDTSAKVGAVGNKMGPVVTLPQHQDHLQCTDQALWVQLTAKNSLSKDIHLLCLNAMCDNVVSCGKSCLHHVTANVPAADLPKWRQCTFSTSCSEYKAYGMRQECADKCLQSHKREVRRQEDERRQRAEERRKKEAEALLQSSGASVNVVAMAAVTMAAVLAQLW